MLGMFCAIATGTNMNADTRPAETRSSESICIDFLRGRFDHSSGKQHAVRRRKAQQHILAWLVVGIPAAADHAQQDTIHVDHVVGLRTDEASARHPALERIHALLW